MSDETPATRTDPATGTEGDTDQLTGEDQLSDRAVDDALDEGYSPPERPRTNHWGETAWEESHGEPMDLRLRQEEPEVWDEDARPSDPDRAGRLVADDDALSDHRPNDVFGQDAGIAGGAASAEEAAVHIVDEDDAGLGTT